MKKILTLTLAALIDFSCDLYCCVSVLCYLKSVLHDLFNTEKTDNANPPQYSKKRQPKKSGCPCSYVYSRYNSVLCHFEKSISYRSPWENSTPLVRRMRRMTVFGSLSLL